MSLLAIWDLIGANAPQIGVVIGLIGVVPKLVQPKRIPTWIAIVLVAMAIATMTYGCAPAAKASEPALHLTETPNLVEVTGPSEDLQRLCGSVSGLLNPRPLKAVLYAHANQWYVQPFTEQPFTELHADGSFCGQTHNGNRYAVLIVQPTYHPPATANALPTSGGEVIAVFEIEGP